MSLSYMLKVVLDKNRLRTRTLKEETLYLHKEIYIKTYDYMVPIPYIYLKVGNVSFIEGLF